MEETQVKVVGLRYSSVKKQFGTVVQTRPVLEASWPHLTLPSPNMLFGIPGCQRSTQWENSGLLSKNQGGQIQYQVDFPVLDSKQAFLLSSVNNGFIRFVGFVVFFFIMSQPKAVYQLFGRGKFIVN